MMNATANKSPAPFAKASTKSLSLSLASNPISIDPTRNTVVISTYHQSSIETPMIMITKQSVNTVNINLCLPVSTSLLSISNPNFDSNSSF